MLLIISIDGMRPDGLLAADAPTMHGLIETGASTMRAQTLMPCCTLPCHTSMMRGVDVPRHGINSNTFQPIVRPVPSVLDVAARAGLRCGTFFNWGPLRDLWDPETPHVSTFVRDAHRPHGDDRVTDEALRSLKHDRLDVAFVYLGYTDECGHAHGWMSAAYLDAIANADHCVTRLLEAVPDANGILLSDHGGHERTHGTELPEDMTIPWITFGPRVRPGHTIARDVVIYDTAPSAAHLLNLPPAPEWDGCVVDEAYL